MVEMEEAAGRTARYLCMGRHSLLLSKRMYQKGDTTRRLSRLATTAWPRGLNRRIDVFRRATRSV